MLGRRNFLELAAIAGLAAPAALARGGGIAATDAGADAAAMALALKDGRTSAPELVEAASARLAAVNGKLNATHILYPGRAAAEAKTYLKGSPLAGIPTFIKDLAPEKGVVASEGSRAFAGRVADVDSPSVMAVRAAGLIPLGRTTAPEFGLLPTTEPLLTGATRNPWNPGHSVGGSSGGAAALVAAGVVPVAHASDGGGSIRIPASMTGLVGLKPSRGRMAGEESATGVLAFGVNGCLSRSVRDTAAWLAACESRGGALPPVGLVVGPARRALRIGVRAAGALGTAPDSDVAAVFAATQQMLGRMGHRTVEAPLPFDGPAVVAAFELLWGGGAAKDIGRAGQFLGRPPTADDIEPATFGFASLARGHAPADFEAAAATLAAMAARYLGQFDAFDVLMTPVIGTAPPEIGHLAPTTPFDQLRARLRAIVGYTPVENAAGNPAIALPMGLTRGGLPVGMQFAAPVGGERLLLELAYSLEAERQWSRTRPPLWAA